MYGINLALEIDVKKVMKNVKIFSKETKIKCCKTELNNNQGNRKSRITLKLSLSQ